jgi:hypothetical protein
MNNKKLQFCIEIPKGQSSLFGIQDFLKTRLGGIEINFDDISSGKLQNRYILIYPR